ncbi:HTH domain-containing protein [Nonomuraea sp. KC401]|nr:helix-turn-helix domain-containing protein [Nonomuraea sp. K271]TLF45974.1 HTH domain-containing protein [Nonomuraea sp. KC401]
MTTDQVTLRVWCLPGSIVIAGTGWSFRRRSALLTQPNATVSSIARLLNVSRSTIYKYVPELATGRPAVEQSAARVELETGG